MDFNLGEDRQLLASTLREILEDHCTPAAVRASWDDAAGRVKDLWEILAGTGILGLLAPEENGGLELDERDLVLLLEELGRAACPDPVAEHAAIAVPVLRDLAPGALSDRWLAGAASGSFVLTAGSPLDSSVLAGATARAGRGRQGQARAQEAEHPDFKRMWMDKLQTLMQQVDKATFI